MLDWFAPAITRFLKYFARTIKMQQMFTMNTKKEPPEVFYKKAVLKNFSILTGRHLCWSLFFNQFVVLQVCNFIKKRFQHRCFSVNIAKFLKTHILKKICELLLLNNVKPNFSFVYLKKMLIFLKTRRNTPVPECLF